MLESNTKKDNRQLVGCTILTRYWLVTWRNIQYKIQKKPVLLPSAPPQILIIDLVNKWLKSRSLSLMLQFSGCSGHIVRDQPQLLQTGNFKHVSQYPFVSHSELQCCGTWVLLASPAGRPRWLGRHQVLHPPPPGRGKSRSSYIKKVT